MNNERSEPYLWPTFFAARDWGDAYIKAWPAWRVEARSGLSGVEWFAIRLTPGGPYVDDAFCVRMDKLSEVAEELDRETRQSMHRDPKGPDHES